MEALMIHSWSYKSQKSAEFLRPRLEAMGIRPKMFMILGSGFRDVLSYWDERGRIAMTDIPGYPSPKVKGHGSDLVMVRIHCNDQSVDILAATGRVHLYEGHTPFDAGFPVFLANALGIKSLILTNAAGGLTPKAATGSVIAIADHINLTGHNVSASNHPSEPVKFTDLTNAYDLDWRQHVAAATGIGSAIYAGMLGPTFETPAEANMLRMIGADLAGMSTIQETIAARMCGIKVFACSFVTNQAGTKESDHDLVLKSVDAHAKSIKAVLEAAVIY